MFRSIATLVLVLVVFVGLPGCGRSQRQRVTVEQSAPSTGQQLKELKEAYEVGAINEKEYNRIRKRIVSGKGR